MLAMFGQDLSLSQQRYRQFVEILNGPNGKEYGIAPDQTVASTILGSEGFPRCPAGRWYMVPVCSRHRLLAPYCRQKDASKHKIRGEKLILSCYYEQLPWSDPSLTRVAYAQLTERGSPSLRSPGSSVPRRLIMPTQFLWSRRWLTRGNGDGRQRTPYPLLCRATWADDRSPLPNGAPVGGSTSGTLDTPSVKTPTDRYWMP